MTKRLGPITLDGETADRITLLNLKEWRSYYKKELAEWRKNPRSEDNPTGVWMHPDDVVLNTRTIDALNLLIRQME